MSDHLCPTSQQSPVSDHWAVKCDRQINSRLCQTPASDQMAVTCVRLAGSRLPVENNSRCFHLYFWNDCNNKVCETIRQSTASDQPAVIRVRPPPSDQLAFTCVRPLGGHVGRTTRQSNPCQTSCVKPVSGRLPGTLFAPIFLWNGCCNNEFLLMFVAAMTQVRGKQTKTKPVGSAERARRCRNSEQVDVFLVSKSMSRKQTCLLRK